MTRRCRDGELAFTLSGNPLKRYGPGMGSGDLRLPLAVNGLAIYARDRGE